LRASDAFEHGFSGFDHVRKLAAASTGKAFGYVRRAILREIGISHDSGLLAETYDFPLADWRPVLELQGTYTDSAVKRGPGFTADDFRDEWPDFLGPSLLPRMSRVVDNPDGSRTVDLTVDGHGGTLTENQKVNLTESRWLLPNKEAETVEKAGTLKRVTLNSNDITAEVSRQDGQENAS
jgi:hypothetical protein